MQDKYFDAEYNKAKKIFKKLTPEFKAAEINRGMTNLGFNKGSQSIFKRYPRSRPEFKRYPRTKYKSTAWRRDAWKFLAKKNRQHGGTFLKNALHNFRKYSYMVGWTAKTAKGRAHAAQKVWRKKYFKNHNGDVV